MQNYLRIPKKSSNFARYFDITLLRNYVSTKNFTKKNNNNNGRKQRNYSE